MNLKSFFFILIGFTLTANTAIAGDPCAAPTITVGEKNACSSNAVPVAFSTNSGVTDLGCGGSLIHKDWWGTFVATSNKTTMRLFNFTGGTRNLSSIALYQGSCGVNLTLLTCATTPENTTNDFIDGYPTVIGQQYFIRVQNGIGLGLGGTAKVCVYNTPENNDNLFCTPELSFETGNLNTWDGNHGKTYSSCDPLDYYMCWDSPSTGMSVGAINEPLVTLNQHSIMTGTGRDPLTGNVVSVVYPLGGKYSLRLGSTEKKRMTKKTYHSFVVTPATRGFMYHYAVVLQDPSHPFDEQPRFITRLLDSGGNPIVVIDTSGLTGLECGSYEVVSQPGLPGWQTSVDHSGTWFTDWTTVALDLADYMGQTLTIEFQASSCGQGAHYGYAYVDISCIEFVISGIEVCAGDATATLTAVSGFKDYYWQHSGETTQTVTINNPKEGDEYCVAQSTFSGCPAKWLCDTIRIIDAKVGEDSITTCKEDTLTLSASGGSNYSWQAIDGGLIVAANTTARPKVTTELPASVIDVVRGYEVTVTGNNPLCLSKDTVWVTFKAKCYPAPILSATDSSICVGDSTVLTVTTTGDNPPFTYVWDNGITIITAGPYTVWPITTTTYKVIATDIKGLKDSTTLEIIVNNLPVGNNITRSACENTSGTQVTGIDLTSYETAVGGGVTYKWYSDMLLTTLVPVPNNATLSDQNYYVEITDLNGCMDTSILTYKVDTLPLVKAGLNDTICFSDTLTLTASGAGVGGSYSWSAPLGIITSGGNTASPRVTTNDPAPAADVFLDFIVEASNTKGCKAVDTVAVLFEKDCSPQLKLAASKIEICLGDSSVLTPTVRNGKDPFTYVWDNGITIINEGPYTVKPLVSTTYKVEVTDDIGRKADAEVTVTVNNPPVGNNILKEGCENVSSGGEVTGVNLIAFQNDIALPALVYHWYSDITLTTLVTNPTTATLKSQSYYVLLTNAKGCKDTATLAYTVKVKPEANAGLDTSFCSGKNVLLNGTGGGTYLWSPAANLNNAAISNPTANPGSTTNYQLVVTALNMCKDTNMVKVQVNKTPVASFNFSNTCVNQAVLFTKTSAPTGTISLWTFGDGNSSTVTHPFHKYSGAATYTVVLVDSTIYGCADKISRQVTIYPIPVVAFSADVLEECPEVPRVFSIDPLGYDPAYAYSWNFGDGQGDFSQAATNSAYTYLYDHTGSFDVTLTATSPAPQNCSNDTTRKAYIAVYPSPVAAFTANPQETTIYNPEIIFTNQSTDDAHWDWSFGTGASSILENPVYTYADTGHFEVVLAVESTQQCKDTAVAIIFIKEVFTFFAPNTFTPNGDGTNDVFMPKFHAENSAAFQFTIYNRWGELIYESKDIDAPWDGTFQGERVATGLYVWKVKIEDVYGESYNYVGNVNVLY